MAAGAQEEAESPDEYRKLSKTHDHKKEKCHSGECEVDVFGNANKKNN